MAQWRHGKEILIPTPRPGRRSSNRLCRSVRFSDATVSVDSALALVDQSASGACNIKGNVSVSSGERIYHVPGQEYYDETEIRAGNGERWFCSEAEARAAGWRRSKV